MLNFLSNLTPNQMLLLGAALTASPVVLSNEKVKGWIKDKSSSLSPVLSKLLPWNWGKDSVTPLVAPAPSGVVIDTPLSVHQVVTPLMAFFARNQDEVGVQLAGAVGQHMYEHTAKWMSAPKLTQAVKAE